MVVASFAVSFAVFVCAPPLTVARLVTLDAALLATVAVRVIAEYDEPAPSAAVVVQVAVATVHVHPEPLRAVAVRPVGTVSTMVTVPDVVAVPVLEMVNVY